MAVTEGVQACEGVVDCVNVGLPDALRVELCVMEGVLDRVRDCVELCDVVCDAVLVRDAVCDFVPVSDPVLLDVTDAVDDTDAVCVADAVGVCERDTPATGVASTRKI